MTIEEKDKVIACILSFKQIICFVQEAVLE